MSCIVNVQCSSEKIMDMFKFPGKWTWTDIPAHSEHHPCDLSTAANRAEALRWHIKKTSRAWRWWPGKVNMCSLICLSQMCDSLSFFPSDLIMNLALMKAMSWRQRDYPQLRQAGGKKRGEEVYNSWQEIVHFHSHSTLTVRHRSWWCPEEKKKS